MRRLLVCVLAAGLAGCGGDGRPAHAPAVPVSGRVTVNGQPAAGALVVFHATARGLEAGPSPFATTAADGSYRLTFYTADEGAPEGEYAVTVVWNVKAKEAKFAIGDGGGTADKLGGRYADLRTPKLTAVVKKGEPNTFDFDLR